MRTQPHQLSLVLAGLSLVGCADPAPDRKETDRLRFVEELRPPTCPPPRRGGTRRRCTAESLDKVLDHHKRALEFDFTTQERDDLIAFLKAL